jgi:hypothetical protein
LWVCQYNQPIILSDEFKSSPLLNVIPADMSIPIRQMDGGAADTHQHDPGSVQLGYISQLGAY